MKNIYLLLILSLISLNIFAEIQSATGDIGEIRYHDSSMSINPPWQKIVWFELINPDTSLCTNNKISIGEDNNTAISLILAAKMANKKMSITVDDTIKLPIGTTYCRLQYLSIQ